MGTSPSQPAIGATAAGVGIAEHILRFARLLRKAGLPIGPDRVVLATEAVLAAGVTSRSLVYWTLHAVLVTRREQHDLYDQAFSVWWQAPAHLQKSLEAMLRGDAAGLPAGARELARRLADALAPDDDSPPKPDEDDVEVDARGRFSATEALRDKDFAAMSADDLRAAKAAIASMPLVTKAIRTRRFSSAARGERIDIKRILRETAARGPDHVRVGFRARQWRRPPLVVLCDISGSMETYARILLHFLYALANGRERVQAFLFGTRLTRVTHALRGHDADLAIARVARDVKDWSGGTRIGDTLAEFNRLWARRLLGQNGLVLLITDGLDREGGEGIAAAVRPLKASSRRLVWVNPLLRYDGYAPLAAGARELAQQIGEVRPCHNLKSLEDLAAALGSPRSAVSAAKARVR